ncbi:hypothetical protein [Cryptosporangium japonicum]|uniref:Uncharacterized protein n=1 Tax=Cryptosporangium japonicum TaxID=80872 RepID=A0ABN0U0J2_9ACTN
MTQRAPGRGTTRSRTALLLGAGGLVLGAVYLGSWYLGVAPLPAGVAALVVGVAALGGVGLGAVALRDCERHRRPGSGAALAAVVSGALALPFAVVAAVLAASPVIGVAVVR